MGISKNFEILQREERVRELERALEKERGRQLALIGTAVQFTYPSIDLFHKFGAQVKLAGMVTQAREGHYFKVLERHKRILGTYELVHFRKPNSSISSTNISIAPRRASRQQYVRFGKATAALFLRQTETQWLHPNFTRQEATKLLLDKPIGSFIVRNSQSAPYALSLRIDEVEDTPVKHFLIQPNQQNYLIIQGSNLPFVSIYDLLAYFCFHQSGGMPCCLKPPKPNDEDFKLEGSDSSDSDSETESDHPPALPPRTASMSNMSRLEHRGHGVEQKIPRNERETASSERDTVRTKQRTRGDKGLDSMGQRWNEVKATVKKKVAPPKPPRPAEGWDDDESPEKMKNGAVRSEELGHIVRRVGSIVDVTSKELLQTAKKHPLLTEAEFKPHPQDSLSMKRPIPKPRLLRRLSKSLEGLKVTDSSHTFSDSTPKQVNFTSVSKRSVSSLIEMFESKSPATSPKQRSFFKRKSSPALTDKNTVSPKKISPNQRRLPIPPPKPKVIVPPLPPRPLSTDYGKDGVPIIPPRTPAPLLPPKPPGSLPPSVLPRSKHRRSLSDTPKLEPIPPEIPPKRRRVPAGYEVMPLSRDDTIEPSKSEDGSPKSTGASQSTDMESYSLGYWSEGALVDPEVSKAEVDQAGSLGDDVMLAEVDNTTKGWLIVPPSDQVEVTKATKWRHIKRLEWAKKFQFRPRRRKPRKRLRKYILDLAADQSQEFGQKISEFVTEMRTHSTEPHQKMLMEIRNFITAMHESLLQDHQNDLNDCGMESCDNAGHVVECTLQECILQPLSHFVYLRIEEYYATNGYLFQVQRSIHQGKLKSTEEMGIRPHLLVPTEKVIADMVTLFNRMMKTYCAISKLEYLLEVVRLTYENIRDSRQPKKPMNDLGADDFLPIFVWVLVKCGFTRAEIEAEYMWGLAHPSLFNGEGGYYLTTLTSAINVLKELTITTQQSPPQQQLPTMNNLQTELKVFFEDEQTGQYSSAYYLPIVPTMTVAEICEIIVERRQISNPNDYGLFTVEDGKATMMPEDSKPQVVKLKWTLQRSLEQSQGIQSANSQFFAYKLRTPENVTANY